MAHRLFAALRPPPAIRATLAAAMAGIEGARWQTDNQLHLTLAFLGELDRHQAEAAAQALATVHAPPLSLRLGQLGSFDAARPGRTGTLWVGVEDAPLPEQFPHPGPRLSSPVQPESAGTLASLAHAIRNSFRRAGLAPDPRKFTPHITLARFGPAGAPREVIRPWLTHATPPPLSWQAESIHLVESTLGREGAHYTPVASFPLG